MMRVASYDDTKRENYRENASYLSQLTFWYTWPIFKMGRRGDIQESDLTKPLDEHKSSKLGHKMAIIWSREFESATKRNAMPSMMKVIFRCFYKHVILYAVVLIILEFGIRTFQPLLLGLLLRYYDPENANNTRPLGHPMYFMRLFYYFTPDQPPIQREEAYFFAFGLFMTSVLNVVIMHPYMMGTMHIGMKVRVACCSLIYRKALRLNLTVLGGQTVGNVVNLMSNDVNRFDFAPVFFHYLWLAPLQLLFLLYFMYRVMGISAVIGISALLTFIPLQVWFGHMISILRYRTALRTDERVRQMNEIIRGMQVIKMYTWEYAFSDLIAKSRRNEIKVLKYVSYIRGLIMSFIMFTTRFGIFLTVFSYVSYGHTITPENVFVITAYYQIFRQTMSVFFPQCVAHGAEAYVSVQRILTFMMTPETFVGDPSPMDPKWKEKSSSRLRYPNNFRFDQYHESYERDPSIMIENVWARYDNDICLRDISLHLKPGTLTAIIGHVGSGKSCLINLMLGELEAYQGSVIVDGSISYAAQEPWLFAGSVRQNILFGREYERNRYKEVVKVCALARDFRLLPYGDRTIVGERGISLSGGQRARVNLARAVYKQADIYLLDDPLSAVDTQVGKMLFDNCIKGYLSKRIVVLVTHQIQYLQHVNHIIILERGAIAASGTYTYLQSTGLNFAELLKEQPQQKEDETTDEKMEKSSINRSKTYISSDSKILIDLGEYEEPPEVAEMRTEGAVECYIYKEYFKAGGPCIVIFIMVSLYLLAQFFASIGDYFVSEWIAFERDPIQNNVIWGSTLSRQQCIVIYSMFILMTAAVAVTRSVVFFTVCMNASINLHNRMFNSIIRGAMRFFNTNTSGRILNRFSKDLGAIDEFLPNSMIDSTQIILNLVGAVVVVGAINLYLLIPTSFCCVAFYYLRRDYLMTSRSVKRLEGITRSPVFAHLNATLQGLTTIRAHGAEMILVSEFDKYQDVHSSAYFMFLAVSRAFSFWLDCICTLYIGLVTASFFMLGADTNGEEVGLAITQCIGLSGLFQWGLRQSAELETQMTSVERVLEFTRIEHEGALESEPNKKPPEDWPEEGRIEFKDAYMRYSIDEPPVLKDLSFVIEPQEKIGIVGRTGAGKSSLIAALFRLAYFEGQVIIDGIDTSQIGLHDLRRKISIIPQEPVLFSGTLRYNLDPFHEYDDMALVSALQFVEIKLAIMHGADCLEMMMAEEGSNLSVGERQLVCLARAIIRDNIILVMDEATANVDAQTDKLIQSTIRTLFAKCTVLTVAHRLNTVMDSDRVLVMDAGSVVEFDHPHILLQKSNGYLTQMVNRTGPRMAENLRSVAKQSFQNRKSK